MQIVVAILTIIVGRESGRGSCRLSYKKMCNVAIFHL